MEKIIEKLRETDDLAFHYVRGSTLYGTRDPNGTSDIDTTFIFTSNPNYYLGLAVGYKDYISDKKGDNTGYELVKWVRGINTSNPTMLESLFIPDRHIIYDSGLLNGFKEIRDSLLTKAIYYPFIGYSKQQIHKARGLNKKIVNPMDDERKDVLDFCYVPFRQGSTNIKNWLEYRGMKQEYCGLNNVPNMIMCHHLFYDWGSHFKNEKISDWAIMDAVEKTPREMTTTFLTSLFKGDEMDKKEYDEMYRRAQLRQMYDFIVNTYRLNYGENAFYDWFEQQQPKGYKGICKQNANEVRLSSIVKNEMPLTTMTFNINAYSQHCKDYNEYQTWKKERNEARYLSNLEKSYDSKNLYHCFRLMAMGKEILEGKGMILDRREAGDADFLIDIRKHRYEYDELMDILEKNKEELDKTYKDSILPEKLDINITNDVLVEIQKNMLKKKFFMG